MDLGGAERLPQGSGWMLLTLRQLAFALAALLILCCQAACDSASAPPPPSTVAAGNSTGDASDSSTSQDESDSGDTTLGGGTSCSDTSGTSTASLTDPVSFDVGGADVGDDDTKKAVTTCQGSMKLFDRFSGDSGVCSDVDLASMDCTKDGIEKLLTANQKTQFEAEINGAYKGWLIDQCADCPEDSTSDICKSSIGVKQTGTKVLFVLEDDQGLRGKAIVLPVRPPKVANAQPASAGSSDSSSDTSSSCGT